jgi:hypothetical protein
MYWVYMDRRVNIQDRQTELELQTFNLFPERWETVYKDQFISSLLGDDAQEEEPVTDLEMLDRWYQEMVEQGGKQTISGADLGQDWSDWT